MTHSSLGHIWYRKERSSCTVNPRLHLVLALSQEAWPDDGIIYSIDVNVIAKFTVNVYAGSISVTQTRQRSPRPIKRDSDLVTSLKGCSYRISQSAILYSPRLGAWTTQGGSANAFNWALRAVPLFNIPLFVINKAVPRSKTKLIFNILSWTN